MARLLSIVLEWSACIGPERMIESNQIKVKNRPKIKKGR
ncbi:hypothetical protein VCR15J2_20841 [Vibrio coralliirubri]|nr:hypothetical protein VCR15J2_20841 [Vibrio coralliirubri]